jgi:hypothetical protein
MQNVMMMEFRISGKELLLDYELMTEKCSWSIFDIGGVEMCKGLLKGNGPHIIPVACLEPALYQLCVIDGDKLLNTKFKIS